MAVLEKIRVKMGVFITILIALALLSFIIDPGSLQSAMSMFSSKYDVGSIDGKGISYQDYQKRVEYYSKIYELTSGTSNVDEQAQEMINNTAWQNEITDYLLIPMAKSAGLKLGTAELLDLSQGNNISPVILNEPSFKDESGNFSREKLIQLVQSIPQDNSGNLKLYWNYLEDNMKSDQMLTKYISLLGKSNFTNPVELKRAIAENNTTYDVSFVVKPFGFNADSSIIVTDQDIKKYYEKNKSNFRQQASRDISYVVFEVEPSDEDIKLSENAMSGLMDEFSTTDKMKNFLARNSDRPFNQMYFKENELSIDGDSIGELIKNSSIGSVIPYRKVDDSFIAARLMDIKSLPDSVKVSHILLQGDLMQKADSLISEINKGANTYENIAIAFSADKNSINNGGELGWMTQQYIIPGFEKIFDAKVGEILKIETNYGMHIVKVTEKTQPVKKYQVALLVKEITSGKETYAEHYAKASDLVTKSEGKLDKFNKAVEESGLYAAPAMKMLANAKNLGNYQHTKEISKWANEHKVGEVSPVITVDNKYFFVVALTGIHEEGIATLNEVAPEIRTIVMLDKKGDKIAEETKAVVDGLNSIDAIAEKLGTTVSNQSGVAFSSLTSQQMDPKFVGAIAGAQEGKIMGPVKGEIGVYYFIVNGKEIGAFYTENDAQQRKDQQFNYMSRMLPAIMSDGKVVDNRYKFF